LSQEVEAVEVGQVRTLPELVVEQAECVLELWP
jgi:hypothetical protein